MSDEIYIMRIPYQMDPLLFGHRTKSLLVSLIYSKTKVFLTDFSTRKTITLESSPVYENPNIKVLISCPEDAKKGRGTEQLK